MGTLGLFLVLFPKNDVMVWATFAQRYAGTVYIPSWSLILSYLATDLLGALTLRSFDYCRLQSWLLRYSIPACTRHQLEAVKGAVAVDVIALFHVVY